MFSQEQGVPELKGSIAQIVQERCCVFHSSSQTVLFQKDQCIARRRTRPRCAHGFSFAKCVKTVLPREVLFAKCFPRSKAFQSLRAARAARLRLFRNGVAFFILSSQTLPFQKDQCIARRRTRPRCAHCFWHGFWVAKFSCSLREGQHLGRAQRQEENKATHLPKAGCSRQRLPCLPIVVFVKQPSVDKNAAASRTHWRVYGWGIFTVST